MWSVQDEKERIKKAEDMAQLEEEMRSAQKAEMLLAQKAALQQKQKEALIRKQAGEQVG